uniref:Uncharacterized protein n=1 Tax=Anguilla anguilla TaxID=7936 RepID=A0A0E9P6R9_ANGAN
MVRLHMQFLTWAAGGSVAGVCCPVLHWLPAHSQQLWC